MTTTEPTPTAEAPALLPCPFCGGAPSVIDDYAETGMAWIACKNCGADTAITDNKAAAIAAWNRRAGPTAHGLPVATPQVEALRMVGAILDALIRYGHPASPALAVALATCAQGLEGDMQPAPAYAAILAAVEDQRDRYRHLLAETLPYLTDDAATPLRRRAAAALNPLDAQPIGDQLPAEPVRP